MTRYAIYEVRSLLSSLPSQLDDRAPQVRYLCALMSELPYYHIPQWEIDDRKRAKLIPCEAYQNLVSLRRSIDLVTLFPALELPRGFVAADRGVVAAGTVLNKILFIGFRGTQFLFDWKINLNARLTRSSELTRVRGPYVYSSLLGGLHSGFAEEALRISSRIIDAVRDAKLDEFNYVFLTGHSLGGAIAAIAEAFIRLGPTSVCIIGSPRYADVSHYLGLASGPPAQVRRQGDMVPTVPPSSLGYVDHPYEFATDGNGYVDPDTYYSSFGDVLRWARFLLGRFQSHSIELYRRELGATAHALGANSPLIPEQRLTSNDVS